MSKVLVGVDLGGSSAKVAVVSAKGEIIEKGSVPTSDEPGPEPVMTGSEKTVQSVLNRAGLSRKDVLAVGIGAPGPLNWQTGLVYSLTNLHGWKDVALADEMAGRLGMPVYLDNDANVACYGEFWSGAGKDVDCMCLLTLGTGVGGGLVVFGRLLRGPDGTAAEIGHINVMRDGRPCNCGAKGCLETYASVTGLLRTVREGIENGKHTILVDMADQDISNITGQMVSDAIDKGDEFAQWAMAETGQWLGTGIASLINLFNPEKIVLGGGMTAAGDHLLKPLRETAKAQAFDVPAKRAKIVLAAHGNDAGVIGAAGCALDRYNLQAS